MGFLLQPYTHGLEASCGMDTAHMMDQDHRNITITAGILTHEAPHILILTLIQLFLKKPGEIIIYLK